MPAKKKPPFPETLYVWRETDGHESYFIESDDVDRIADGQFAQYKLVQLGTKKSVTQVEYSYGTKK